MQLEVTLTKSGKFWVSEIAALDIMSQGTTKIEAVMMAISALKDLVSHYFEEGINVEPIGIERLGKRKSCFVRTSDYDTIVAFIVKHLRVKSETSVRGMASKLSVKGTGSVTQYESGKHCPSLEKIDAILRAFGKELRIDIADLK